MPSNELTRKATPARLPVADRVRLRAGTLAGDAAALASRLLKRGSGASIRGQLLTRIAPDAFGSLLQGRRIVAVTGTNGKTTTTHFVAAAIRQALGADSPRLVTNADGANLHYGIASELAKHRHADIAVLETDERVIPDLLAKSRPEVLVMLNFSRDQLDRNFEIKFLARAWRDALERAGADGPAVVANSDDPLVTWAAEKAHHVVWVDTAASWSADAALCPACGAILDRREPVGDVTGAWDCPNCELTEQKASYLVQGDRIVTPDGRTIAPDLNVPGKFNVSNAACALAACHLMGVDTDTALIGFRTVSAPAGRFATATFGATTARLLLAKNPAGWLEALPLATSDTVVLAIDAIAADGNDPSWLWDVDYEQLQGRHVIVTGPRAYDLAVRLEYAEVDHEVIIDLQKALDAAASASPIDLISTYTPFQQLLKMAGLR